MTETIQGLGRAKIHYSGKTKDECNQNQTFFNKLFKGDEIKLFDKIDKDGDGILSAEEICGQRDKYSKNYLRYSMFGASALGLGLSASVQFDKINSILMKHGNKFGLGVAGVLALFLASTIKNEKNQKETQEYREKFLQVQEPEPIEEKQELDEVV